MNGISIHGPNDAGQVNIDEAGFQLTCGGCVRGLRAGRGGRGTKVGGQALRGREALVGVPNVATTRTRMVRLTLDLALNGGAWVAGT